MKNMTKGSPLWLILSFTLPLLLGNLLQQTYSLADTAIVARFLGPDALAAVGATASVQFLVLGFCTGSCAGMCIPLARDFGSGSMSNVRRGIYNGIWLVGIMAAFMTVLCAILTPQILAILNTPANIYDDTKIYIFIIFLGMPFTLLYNYTASILRSIGDSRTPFIFLAVSAVLNIALDVFCIVALSWGCAGAAIATIVSQAVSGIACTIYIIRNYPMLHFERSETKIAPAVMKELALMGFPMGLQFSITAIGSMVMQSATNALGSTYVSAFTAASRIKQFAMCPFDAIGTSVSTFASQNDGANKGRRTHEGLTIGLTLGISYSIVIGAVLIFFGRELSLLFVSADKTEILSASTQMLVASGFFYWLLAVLNVCRPTLQSLGFTGRAMNAGVLEMIARCVVCLLLVPEFGFMAICFADQAAWLMAAAFVFIACLKEVKKGEHRYEDSIAPLYAQIGVSIPKRHSGLPKPSIKALLPMLEIHAKTSGAFVSFVKA